MMIFSLQKMTDNLFENLKQNDKGKVDIPPE